MGLSKSRFKQQPMKNLNPQNNNNNNATFTVDNQILQRLRPPRRSLSKSPQYQDEPMDLSFKPPTASTSTGSLSSNTLSSNDSTIGRCSTPSQEYCDHCLHAHSQDCCLYVHDTEDDKERYAKFKKNLETTPFVKPKWMPFMPEAISGNSTPSHFPEFTPNDPAVFEKKMIPPQWTSMHAAAAAAAATNYYFQQYYYNAYPMYYTTPVQYSDNYSNQHHQQQQQQHHYEPIYANVPQQVYASPMFNLGPVYHMQCPQVFYV